MTQVADVTPRSDRPSPSRRHDICPFLLADSAWRSASPAKEHRCLALGADLPLALDKQKRLCLTSEHRSCPAYTTAVGVADGADEATSPKAGLPRRPYPRMAPVIVDLGRMGLSLPAAARDRPASQIALAGLMVVAFAAIALARLSGVGGGGVAAVAPSLPPEASIVAAAPSPTPAPTSRTVPSAAPSLAPSPEPSPTADLRTYKVKQGDTLIKIAARFDTTVRALIELNNIDDPARIPIGARLKIPPAD
jgi:hypothetical protein